MNSFRIICIAVSILAGFSASASKQANIFERVMGLAELYPNGRLEKPAAFIDLTAYVFLNSGWTEEEIPAYFVRAAEVFSQCALQIESVRIVLRDAPASGLDVDHSSNSNQGKTFQIAKAAGLATQASVYFVRYIDRGIAHSYPESLFLDTPMINTAWISVIEKLPENRSFHRPSYSVVAHELGHLLTNKGHFNGRSKNLMGNQLGMNDRLNRDQCDVILSSSLVRYER